MDSLSSSTVPSSYESCSNGRKKRRMLLLSRSVQFHSTTVPSRKKYKSRHSSPTLYFAVTCSTSGSVSMSSLDRNCFGS
uniref:Uncharacterized protein n=1 Tax=Anopheles christyi TaxID=43041 RepID=A0A182KIE3_9DIPT